MDKSLLLSEASYEANWQLLKEIRTYLGSSNE